MDFPGMFIEVEPLRTYPYSTLAAHLLGYLGEISELQLQARKDLGYYLGDLVGQAGLEQAFEDVLRGQPGLRQVEVDALGRETQVIAARPATPGMDLVLTLDLPLQQLAERSSTGHSGSIVASTHVMARFSRWRAIRPLIQTPLSPAPLSPRGGP